MDGGPHESRKTERGYSVAKVYLYTCSCYTRKRTIPTRDQYPINELTSEIKDRDIIAIFRKGEIASGTVNRVLRVPTTIFTYREITSLFSKRAEKGISVIAIRHAS